MSRHRGQTQHRGDKALSAPSTLVAFDELAPVNSWIGGARGGATPDPGRPGQEQRALGRSPRPREEEETTKNPRARSGGAGHPEDASGGAAHKEHHPAAGPPGVVGRRGGGINKASSSARHHTDASSSQHNTTTTQQQWLLSPPANDSGHRRAATPAAMRRRGGSARGGGQQALLTTSSRPGRGFFVLLQHAADPPCVVVLRAINRAAFLLFTRHCSCRRSPGGGPSVRQDRQLTTKGGRKKERRVGCGQIMGGRPLFLLMTAALAPPGVLRQPRRRAFAALRCVWTRRLSATSRRRARPCGIKWNEMTSEPQQPWSEKGGRQT